AHLPDPAPKRKCGLARDVSGVQHGDWNGSGRRGARCAARDVDLKGKTNWSYRARLGKDHFEILGASVPAPRRSGAKAGQTPTCCGAAVGVTILPFRRTPCRPARSAARSTSSATRDFNARARVARKTTNSPYGIINHRSTWEIFNCRYTNSANAMR